MIFSRDAILARLNEHAKTSQERTQILSLLTLVNLCFGGAFLFATLFVSSTWGYGFAFQATSTAILQFGLNYMIFNWLKQPDLQKSTSFRNS